MVRVIASQRVAVPTWRELKVRARLVLAQQLITVGLYFAARPAVAPILVLPWAEWPARDGAGPSYSPAQLRVALRECSVRMHGLRVPYRQPQPGRPGLTIVYDTTTSDGYALAVEVAAAACRAINAALSRLPDPPGTGATLGGQAVPIRRVVAGLDPDWPFAPTVCDVLSSPVAPVPCRATFGPGGRDASGRPVGSNPWLECRDCAVRQSGRKAS